MNTILSTSEERVHQAILNAMGPHMRDWLADSSVIEIMLNPDGRLWVERLGKGVNDSGVTMSRSDAETLIRLVASCSGENCNEKSPSLSAILPAGGARFQAFVYPVVEGPTFSVRKKAVQIFSLENYVEQKIMTYKQRDFIARAVIERKNILIAGGTGTGKTTLANAILKVISLTDERIITIEDTPELQCDAENKAQFFTRPEIGFTMQKAVRESLRCRPDRIVVGEVRDGSALDLLKAWNTGHSGGIATVHANNARLALRRLESLIGEVSTNIQRDLICESINVIITIKREFNKRFIDEVVTVSYLRNGEYEIEAIHN